MHKILIILIIGISLYSEDFKLNKFQKEYLEKNEPLVLEKYLETKAEKETTNKDFAIFLLTSSSVPENIYSEYTRSMAELNNLNLKNGVFMRGLDEKAFQYIKGSIQKSEKKKDYAKIKSSIMFDPDFFDNNNLHRVPVMVFSLCEKSKYYPSDCETLFMIKGTANAQLFVSEMVKSSPDYRDILGLNQ